MKQKFLIFILFIACILRLYRIGEVPISPDWDEVALGYNAYSILNTGKDEYGKILPVVLRSFDDYKPALYSYLIIPFLKLIDLNVLAVRLPSVIMGVISIFVIYLLVKEILIYKFMIKDNHNLENKDEITTSSSTKINQRAILISLITAFLMAISPWHLQFSRIAFESNIGLAFNLLMGLFFVKGLRKPLNLIYSSVFAVLSIYTYQSEKVFTPLLFIGLIFIFRNELKKIDIKFLISAILIGFILLLPLFHETINNPDTLLRARGVSIFSDKTVLLERNADRLIMSGKNKDYIGLLFNNRRIIYLKTFIANYISHFDFNWLFIKGDFTINRHHAPYMGLFYVVELPFLLIGLYQLIFSNFPIKTKSLIIYWLLIAPLPASVTQGVPHAVRTLNMLPPVLVLIAIGYYTFYLWLSAFKRLLIPVKIMIISCFGIIFVLNFVYYLNQYFVQQNYEYASDWQYGYKEIVDFVNPIKYKYDKIIVSDKGIMSQSYMFFLFYTKYSPVNYLKTGGTMFDKSRPRINKFENFEFRSFDIINENKSGKKILFIGADADFPDEKDLLFKVSYPNGVTAIKAIER